jgi:Tol biopolymer transport system component
LNHPNIVHIYDIDQQDGIDYIAMEYVAGKTLDRLIPRHGVPLNEALKYSVQIADALTTAHEAGIVHRDLKPGNVMVTDKGHVKILDFGLAKLTETTQGGEDAETRTIRAEEAPNTGEGKIVGTVAYMSPEQAQGKRVDARSDIFSFGSLLYEMITGRRAFQGDTKVSTLAAILKEEPKAASQLVHGLPKEVGRLISRCLRKDPERRFQYMKELRVELEELREESDSGTLEPAPPPKRERKWVWAVAALGVMIIAAGVAGYLLFLRPRTGAPETPLTAVPLTSYPGSEVLPSFSPDGTQVAFQRCPGDPDRGCDIYIKQIGVEPPFQLTDDPAQEYNPVWSPDGRFIAFCRNVSPSELAVILIPQRGGAERLLGTWDFAAMVRWRRLDWPYLAWTPDSKWLAVPIPDPREGRPRAAWALFLLSVETGERRRLTTPPVLPDIRGDTAPAFSPDGRALVFSRETGDTDYLYLLRLSEDYRPLGEPERLEEVKEYSRGTVWLPDGSEIVFTSYGSSGNLGLWRMPIGKPRSPRRLSLPGDRLWDPAVSRQGNRLAYSSWKSDTNIWRAEIPSPGQSPPPPVKFISSTKMDLHPQYSPDGNKIAFVSDRSGSRQIWVCDRDGSNAVQLTFVEGEKVIGMHSWSPDGGRIAFASFADPNQHIYVISSGGGPPVRWTDGSIQACWPRWSRDGQWLYFDSGDRIYKIPDGGGEPVETTVRGNIPTESPDGKTLYITRGWPHDISLWSIPVDGGEETKVLDSIRSGYAIERRGIYFGRKPDNEGRSEVRWAAT